MKKALTFLSLVLFSQILGTALGQDARDPVAEKYAAPLKKIFDLSARFASLDPALEKAYPVAIYLIILQGEP